jgi:hypothetical protein
VSRASSRSYITRTKLVFYNQVEATKIVLTLK